MPNGDSNAEPQKKRSNKKKHHKNRSKSRSRGTDKKESKSSLRSNQNGRENDFNKLTPANLSSLRWDNTLNDTALENDRIEQYKELRRQRYYEAREQAIQTITEKMKKAAPTSSEAKIEQ